jgi:hypothetical protein
MVDAWLAFRVEPTRFGPNHPGGYLNEESSFQPEAGECYNEAVGAFHDDSRVYSPDKCEL